MNITATPDEKDELAALRLKSFVETDRKQVIDEGLIKEKILVQTE